MNGLTGWKKYGVWGVSALLTAAFLMAGGMKLMGSEQIVQNFELWGYPYFFLYVVGLSEVTFGISLWIPKISGLAALGLVSLMVGAVGTHLLAGEMNMLAPPLVLGILSALIFWVRYPETKNLYIQFRHSAPAKN